MTKKMVPAFSTHQLAVNYDKIPVLWDVTLSVPAGHLVGIIGPNGAGKSTLIRTAMGLLQPISGYVEFFGQPLHSQRKRVAYVPQRESVDWDFPITVRELVLMGRYGRLGLFRRLRSADREAADHFLNSVGMSAYAERQISQLSGGQQQRVFIARALMQEADLYFMDEPFAGIDLASEAMIIELLRQLQKAGKTIFVVHHDLNSVESYFDWLILLNMKLVACGPVMDVFTPEQLNATYGKSYSLLVQALRLARAQGSGVIPKSAS